MFIISSICHKQTQPHLFSLVRDYVLHSAKTIIRPPLENFQNKSKYGAIILTIWDPVCFTISITL